MYQVFQIVCDRRASALLALVMVATVFSTNLCGSTPAVGWKGEAGAADLGREILGDRTEQPEGRRDGWNGGAGCSGLPIDLTFCHGQCGAPDSAVTTADSRRRPLHGQLVGALLSQSR